MTQREKSSSFALLLASDKAASAHRPETEIETPTVVFDALGRGGKEKSGGDRIGGGKKTGS